MATAAVNQQPLQIVVNYWEIRPTLMGAKLDELFRRGVTQVASFVPWQAVESDISHTLVRFLQAASERNVRVSLILTPEVGIHYANSGVPKDVMSRTDNLVVTEGGGSVPVLLPPNAFCMPSLLAPELLKRYYSFLTRVDGMLADLGRQSPRALANCEIVLGGSFWKYYRSARGSAKHPYQELSGDRSAAAGLAFRQRLEQTFAQREFADPTPMAASRWKTRQMEETNRRWFNQQSEEVFRNRTYQLARKRAQGVAMSEIELHTPEADPSMTYSQLLMQLSGGHGDFAKLSNMIDESSLRSAHGAMEAAAPYIHWTSLGSFRTLADPEKQFLLLKSLLLLGGRGGGLFIDESEWLSLSHGFRARMESFARSLAHGELKLHNQVLYLTPHLWSGAGTLWSELLPRVGNGAQMIASLEGLEHEEDASLLIVDPAWIMTAASLDRIAAWASRGGVAVVARTPLFTEAAKRRFAELSQGNKHIEIDLGIPYRLHPMGEGKLVIYDSPFGLFGQDGAAGGKPESLAAWQTFLTAVLAVAEVQGYCRISDSRVMVIPLQKKSGLGLFVLNGTRRPIVADLIFQEDISISDLSGDSAAKSAPATRFTLEVPTCGILPLAIEGLETHSVRLMARERKLAARLAAETRSAADLAARSELPGLEDSTWN